MSFSKAAGKFVVQGTTHRNFQALHRTLGVFFRGFPRMAVLNTLQDWSWQLGDEVTALFVSDISYLCTFGVDSGTKFNELQVSNHEAILI